MTTIKESRYSSNITTAPLADLTAGQVALLNKGKTHDISDKVRRVVQGPLGYMGSEEFRVKFTKQKIIFSLTSGSETENRTLICQNGLWMLSQESTTATTLPSTVADEVNHLITDILSKIGQAKGETASTNAAADTVARPTTPSEPVSDAAELNEIRNRLSALEAQLRNHNPNFEESINVQREILAQIARLNEILGGRHPKNDAGMAALQQSGFEKTLKENQAQLENLQGQLARSKKLEQEFQTKATQYRAQITYLEEEFKRVGSIFPQIEKDQNEASAKIKALEEEKAALEAELDAARKEHASPQQAPSANDSRIDELQTQLAQKEAEHKQTLEEFEAGKSQLSEAEKARTQALEQMEEYISLTDQLETKIQSHFELEDRVLAEADTLKAQIAALEKQISSERDRFKEETQKAQAEARAKIADLEEQKAALEASSKKTQSTKIAELTQQIATQKAQLEEINALKASIAQKDTDYASLLAYGQEREEKISELHKQNERLLIELQMAQEDAEKVGPLEEHNRKLIQGIEVAQGLVKRIEDLEAQALKATQELETRQSNIEALQTQLETEKIANLTLKSLESSLQRKDQQLQKIITELDKAKEDTQKAHQAASLLQDQLYNANERFKKAERHNDEERDRTAAASAEAQRALKDLKRQHQLLSQQAEKANADLEAAQKELATLKASRIEKQGSLKIKTKEAELKRGEAASRLQKLYEQHFTGKTSQGKQ